jgi:hypothetical protein
MRIDLDHLPASKRRELERFIQTLFGEVEDANAKAPGKRKLGRIQKVIPYARYAGGGWVDEPRTATGYQFRFRPGGHRQSEEFGISKSNWCGTSARAAVRTAHRMRRDLLCDRTKVGA